MAKWIDRAALWAFAAFSAYLLIFVLTNGSLLFSAILTFGIMALMRILIRKLPEKRWLKRREKAAFAKSILSSWALMETSQAMNAVRQQLPGLIRDTDAAVQLIQRMPDGPALDENQLIDIWKNACDQEKLRVIVTGPVSSQARSLSASLRSPELTVTDSSQLLQMLIRTIREIPPTQKTTGRRTPSKACITRYIQSVKPARTLFYGLFLAGLYLFSRSWLHLTAACLFLILPVIRFCLLRQNPSG